jgi:hypothetical protein
MHSKISFITRICAGTIFTSGMLQWTAALRAVVLLGQRWDNSSLKSSKTYEECRMYWVYFTRVFILLTSTPSDTTGGTISCLGTDSYDLQYVPCCVLQQSVQNASSYMPCQRHFQHIEAIRNTGSADRR